MKVIDAITPLLVESRLFEDPDRIKHASGNHKKKKKNLTHMGLKIGQGGTLDPLADGVLGMSPSYTWHGEYELTSSDGRQQGNKASSTFYRMYQGKSRVSIA